MQSKRTKVSVYDIPGMEFHSGFSFSVGVCFWKSFTVLEKLKLNGIKSQKFKNCERFYVRAELMGAFVAPLRIPVVVRSNVPGGKSGVGHEKGGSEEPPSRKHMVEVLGAYLIIISALVR